MLPRGQFPSFLCYQPKLYLARSLRVFNRAHFFSTHPTRRSGAAGPAGVEGSGATDLLFVTANPLDLPRIDVETEEKMLRFILQEPPELPGVQLEVLHQANAETLGTLRSGNSGLTSSTSPATAPTARTRISAFWLRTCRPSTPTVTIASTRIASAILLQESPCLQFVFANACHGARQGQQGELSAFSGIAQSLHATGVPAVAALQFLIFDRTAHSIVLGFYKFLLRDGLSVETSVTKVRRTCSSQGTCSTRRSGWSSTRPTRHWPGRATSPPRARQIGGERVGRPR